MEPCPCGTGLTYDACCGQYHSGSANAPTPEKLMRSRYSAYVKNDFGYLARTMKGRAAAKFNIEDARKWAQKVEWIRLEVIQTNMENGMGYVEFLAYFYDNKKRHALHELSEFHFEDDAWYYYDGCPPKDRPPFQEAMQKRNDPCVCGSGKKYKKCCGSFV